MNLQQPSFNDNFTLEEGLEEDYLEPDEIFSPLEVEEDAFDFQENLADVLDEGELNRISYELVELIQQDYQSRKEWEAQYLKAKSYLGYKLDEPRNVPFIQACRAFDTTLSVSLLSYVSTAMSEYFPSGGLVDFGVLGEKSDYSYEVGEKIKGFFNYYLTEDDKGYYPDSNRMLNYIALVGCAFRKAYVDPVLKKPFLRFIDPQNFVVNNDCVSILESDRLTHVNYLNKTDILLRQRNGFYRDIPLKALEHAESDDEDDSDTFDRIRKDEGIDTSAYEKKSLFKVYEVHANLVIDGDAYAEDEEKIPLPYIVTILSDGKKVLSIRRNWEENDKTFKRIEYFVGHTYLEGFGLYGLGLGQILGSNSVVLTQILRQCIDTVTLSSFPGGLMAAGMKIEESDKPILPGEFRTIQTGGLPINDVVTNMPYKDPSPVMLELRSQLKKEVEQVGSIVNFNPNDSNPNIPVGTIYFIVENNNKIQGTALKNLHKSLSNELSLLYTLFEKNFPEENMTFYVQNKSISLNKKDFFPNFKIYPKADPQVPTQLQRIAKNEMILRLAKADPQIHNLRNIYIKLYQSMGITDIEEILLNPDDAVPLDVGTENANLIVGKPVVVGAYQDHEAHIIGHKALPDNLLDTPQKKAAAQDHIQNHMAELYILSLQKEIGMVMPPLEQLKNPEVQNMISLQIAEFYKNASEQQKAASPPPLDPNQVMMADINQRREASLLKSQESKQKAKTEAFKAQLKYETDKEKMETQKEIEEEKNKTDILIERMKKSNYL